MGIPLYELTNQFRELEARIASAAEAEANGEEGADEMGQVWKDTLEGIEGSIEMKLIAIAKLVREKRAEAEAIKAEKQRIEKKQRAAEKAEDWLRNYMASAMETTGITKAKDNLISVTYAEGRPKVKVENIEALIGNPSVWKPYKFEEGNIDKTGVKERLEKGEEIPGVTLVADRTLTIR